jgi:hypothetical protein
MNDKTKKGRLKQEKKKEEEEEELKVSIDSSISLSFFLVSFFWLIFF